ncbi:MAG: S41 family peptidase [Treponema sp.]|nr:S41 family peptidase [Treponema sp.]
MFSKKSFFAPLAGLFLLFFFSCENNVSGSDNYIGLGAYVFPETTSVVKTVESSVYGKTGSRIGKFETTYLAGWEDIPFLDLKNASILIGNMNDRGSDYETGSSDGSVLSTYKYYQADAGTNYPAAWKDDTLYFDINNQTIYSDDFLRLISGTREINNDIGCGYFEPVSNASDSSPLIDLSNPSNPSSVVKAKERVVIRLGDYGLRMYMIDGKLYVPFQVLADSFFCSSVCVFNGYDYYVYLSTDNDAYCTGRAYEFGRTPSALRSRLKAEYNYRCLCMLFDLNYCLKEQRSQVGKANISKFNDSIFASGLGFDLLSTDTATYDAALVRFLLSFIDDGHTSYDEPSKYQAYSTISQYKSYGKSVSGSRDKGLGATVDSLYDKRSDMDGGPGVWYVSENDEEKMAVITFDGFNDNDPGSETDLAELAELNTYQFLKQAFEDIDDYSSVQNVVIDLSCNGGGALNQCMLALCFLADPENFYMARRSVLDKSLVKFTYKVNNGVSLKKNYHFYVLTSGCSFSCGNFFPSICKYQLNVPIVGQQSGGGGGIVKSTQTSDGALFKTSASMEMCAIDSSNNYVCIDAGVPVDFEIGYDDFYSGSALYANLYEKLKARYPSNF